MDGRNRRPWARIIALLVAGALVALAMAVVPSGFASTDHPGADNPQSASHGDCKNPGPKSDTFNTSGNHNGYDCVPAPPPPGGSTGPSGPSGPAGPAGPAGAAGAAGTAGTSGANGAPGAASGVLGATATSGKKAIACASRRAFIIHIRQRKGLTYKVATVTLNGKKIKTVRGAKHIRAGIRLTGLPKGTFRVKIKVVATNGKVLRGTRTYHTCVPHLPHGIPKL